MRVTSVRVAYYEKPLAKPVQNAKLTISGSRVVVVTVETDEGVTGTGWVSGGDLVAHAVQTLAQYAVGQDPRCTERIWAACYQPKLFGRRGIMTRALSAIDIACWDLRGKVANLSVYQLLGGCRDRVPAYISGGFYQAGKGVRELVAELEANVDRGVRTVKVKIGGLRLREDLERVRAVRSALGPDVDLLVDANNAYDTATALRMARLLEPLDVYWYEEPVSVDNLRGSAEVAAATPIPLATGENEYTRYGFRDLIEAKAADILNADPQVMGGITEWHRVAAMASAYEMPMAPHGSQEIQVHLVAAVPNGLIVLYTDANVYSLADELFVERLPLNPDGTVTPPTGPGLGVIIDEHALAPYRQG